MNRLKGTIEIKLTVDEVNTINELIARNTAKPMKEYKDSASDLMALCPSCEAVINRNFCFCQNCGQRVMTDVYEL